MSHKVCQTEKGNVHCHTRTHAHTQTHQYNRPALVNHSDPYMDMENEKIIESCIRHGGPEVSLHTPRSRSDHQVLAVRCFLLCVGTGKLFANVTSNFWKGYHGLYSSYVTTAVFMVAKTSSYPWHPPITVSMTNKSQHYEF